MKPMFECVEYDANYSIKFFQYQCESFQKDHDWHFHSEYELSFILEGEGTRLIGDSVEPFGAGDLVIVGPDLPHCWVSAKGQLDNEMIVIQFRSDVVSNNLLGLPELRAVRDVLNLSRRGVRFHFKSAQEKIAIEQKLIALHHAHGAARFTSLLLLLEYLAALDTVDLLASEAYSADFENFHTDKLAKVMHYIRENIGNEIKQTDAAELLKMTPQSFSRFFKASTGRTFVSFVNYMRISHACRLLMSTTQDVSDIAFECGYASLSHFNRQFSELKNTTPTQFREQTRS